MLLLDALTTPRLRLRRLRNEDADAMTRLLQEREIAANTAGIPFPFGRADALAWIDESKDTAIRGIGVTFAVVRAVDSVFVGAVALSIWQEHHRGEVGYWFGKPYWGQGYATESVGRVVRAGFDDLRLNRVEGNCYARNSASARVMLKVGMRYEGTFRQYVWNRINGQYEDMQFYGALREDTASL